MKTATPLPVVEMVGEFQCPGCTCGSKSTMEDCGDIKLVVDTWRCENHSAGTMMFPGGQIYLGMPRGFNKAGLNASYLSADKPHKAIRLWPKDSPPKADQWNNLNVAVWAMEKDGFLFVRTYCPRINANFIDVVEGGSLSLVPNAINVAEFVDEID